ncbi:DUF4166 domain-containing protein [Williamsia sp. CHRR-6]|uniref:DUF4166 domain-containing protein n=1 Tax=Williamsia sp. CHRR-6 TaxID=2835871 RepID=UPI001BD987C5|nr:DUF4166 domain-containing protein [Williamsia sp. CHRR-6]MBT0566982.1 DUF4166 domain-containing protein [Williamsia sp. CHRR-6]
MSPIFRDAMGADFDRLHPNIAWRYSIDSTSDVAQTATGMIDSVRSTSLLTPPVARLFRKRNVMPTTTSRLVPFTQETYCYRDERGRENLAMLYRFAYSQGDQGLHSLLVNGQSGMVNYLGDGPDVLFVLHTRVGPRGSLIQETEPMQFLGKAAKVGMRGLLASTMRYVEEWDDEHQRFRVDVTVRNRILGDVLQFSGWFTAVDRPCRLQDIPDEAWPLRLEERE